MQDVRQCRSSPISVLGLDWDGTVSCYAQPLGLLAAISGHVEIITLNPSITREHAAEVLGVSQGSVSVTTCPAERIVDFQEWKAERCTALRVSLMFDDDYGVIAACRRRGISAIAVAEL